jgi:hypothetical protein
MPSPQLPTQDHESNNFPRGILAIAWNKKSLAILALGHIPNQCQKHRNKGQKA